MANSRNELGKSLIVAFTVLIVGACGGGNPGTGSDPVKSPKPTFDIKDNWKLTSKKCGSVDIAEQAGESYKIDRQFFGIVTISSEVDTQICKNGYFYNRVISSSDWDERTYTEKAVLTPGAGKKTCWKREGGKPVNPPLSEEVFDFKSETKNFAMSATASEIVVDVQSPDCPNGLLHLTLIKS